ncbi:MAG: tetratricopeptide repeat protein [Pyrinomonadaceae bacterium]
MNEPHGQQQFVTTPHRALVSRRRLRASIIVMLCAVACAGTVIGCGWYGGSDHSVRFSGMDERDFGRLPPLSEYATEELPRADDWEEEYELRYEAEERGEQAADELWQQAQAAETSGDLAQARALLRRYLNDRYATDQAKRNTALDLLDAFTALDEGASAAAVQAYLKARHTYYEGMAAQTQSETTAHTEAWQAEAKQQRQETITNVEGALTTLSHAPALRDNVAYLRAAILYRDWDLAAAAQAFNSLVARYPHSEKRVAALYMVGLSHLKQSRSFKDENGETFITGASSPPCPDCRDADWRAARATFTRLLATDPHCAYAADARGWLAFLNLRTGDTGAGLAEYYRMLADTTNAQARVEAIRSLRLARDAANDADMARVEALLTDEPAAALAYAYHNIYNYSFSDYLDVPETDEVQSLAKYVEDNNEYSSAQGKRLDKLRAESQQTAERRELERAAKFATRLLARYPSTHIGGAFAVRLAEAQLELEDAHTAHNFAVRALALGVGGDLRAEALWIKGVAEHRLKEYDAARQTLQLLVAEQPHGQLTEGARRLIAMTAEDAGDLDAALEQYLALDYQTDIAYFIDVLLTPDQLAGYLARHPQTARADELYYALGLRYLRAGRFNEARAAYTHVHAQPDGYTYYGDRKCDEAPHTTANYRASCLNPKFFEDYGGTDDGVHLNWIKRDLQTATELEHLQQQIEQATDDEAKAEALYQLASYNYESSLLFYNPIWNGVRHYQLITLDEQNGYRRPGEAQLLFQHMQEHDAAARALPIYLEVVRRYPNTRAARDAFYTAAVCHDRLADYNEYWRNLYRAGLHAGERMVTYADVRAAYPDYHLPRATYGTYSWEPSTRTVNGGPAWYLPPKPRPRLTGLALFRYRCVKLYNIMLRDAMISWQRAVALWQERVRPWYVLAVLLAGLICTRRVALRARTHLRTQLALHPLSAEITESEDKPAELFASWNFKGWGAQASTYARARVRALWRRVRPLLGDAPGRAALVESTFTHALLTVLFVALLWTMHAS